MEDGALMYEDYFGLSKKPFTIIPDPRFFYQSAGHREALAHLLYGIQSHGGFVLLTGDVGTGKTTACRRLLQHLPENLEVAFILNPKLTAEGLLATICQEFGISIPSGNQSTRVLVSHINDFLLEVQARGRQAVLILEEAQNLEPEVLEQIRLLTNLETNEHKLLQMILVGQPELRDKLNQPRFLQLSQRITARYHLGPLSLEEVPLYVSHRLSVAGLEHNRLFPPATLKKLFRLSQGVPRVINVICDRALLGAFVEGKDRVDKETLVKAAQEISGKKIARGPRPLVWKGLLGMVGLALLAALGIGQYHYQFFPWPGVSAKPIAPALGLQKEKAANLKSNLIRPDNLTEGDIQKKAYAALFKKWHLVYKRGEVCEQAGTQGLRCLKGKGSLINLRQMNKPVVLTLVDKNRADYYGTLTSLQGERATLVLGGEIREVEAREILQYWTGDYLLLWKAPPEYRDDLKPGSRSPLVPWLEKYLTLALGRVVSAGKEQSYEGAMVDQVKKFQLTLGLVPDGIVGQKTIMPLTAFTANGDPVLHDGKGNL